MTSVTIWTRLEPRCRTADMGAALEARTHDPLWMLARQWQLGELLGGDGGSPIVATVESVASSLDRVAAPLAGGARPVPVGTPLEAWIEREAVRPRSGNVDFHQSTEAGLQFRRMLRAAHLDVYGPGYVAQFAIAVPTAAQAATMDATGTRLAGLVAGRVPDGVRLAAQLRGASPGAPTLPATPPIATADVAAMTSVAVTYLSWYDSLFDEPESTQAVSAWHDERMDYSFALDASSNPAPCAFVAAHYIGDPLGWTSFDATASSLGASTAPTAPVTTALIPTPVRFKGMPARRYWEMEDAVVDIGAIEAGPADLGRLMLREFALIYGNDWFIVPLEVPVGSAVRIESLVVTDTFGTAQVVPHYTQTDDGGRWRMFAISGEPAPHGLLVPPVLARSIVGKPLEQVLLVRDEAANMAWGIERIVLGAAGTPLDRTSVPLAPPTPAPTGLRYKLGSTVPDYYIPFVPVSLDATQRRMQRAAFLRTDGSTDLVEPLGRLLGSGARLFEEEFAREGVRVERRFRLARWTDGSTHLWVSRVRELGASAGSSGLQFDQVTDG